jgi:hypothetical protein
MKFRSVGTIAVYGQDGYKSPDSSTYFLSRSFVGSLRQRDGNDTPSAAELLCALSTIYFPFVLLAHNIESTRTPIQRSETALILVSIFGHVHWKDSKHRVEALWNLLWPKTLSGWMMVLRLSKRIRISKRIDAKLPKRWCHYPRFWGLVRSWSCCPNEARSWYEDRFNYSLCDTPNEMLYEIEWPLRRRCNARTLTYHPVGTYELGWIVKH